MKRLAIIALLAILVGEGAATLLLTQRLYITRSHASAPAALNPIQRENQLVGTNTWEITKPAPIDIKAYRSPTIEGYALATSAGSGDTISFAVSTTVPTFRADIYRLGWYQGKGGRLLQSFPQLPGHFFAMPTPDIQTGLIEANWPAAFAVKVEPNWISGIYIAKLSIDTGEQYAIPFVVRSTRASDLAFIYASNSEEAYNNWGGKSLYEYSSTEKHRAYAVSFDRPYLGDAGLTYFILWEYPMLRWLEENGYDVSYLSTNDVQDQPALLQNHHAILIVGRDEYWSQQMREHLEAAVNAGVNLANFAANSIYWQIRYQPASFMISSSQDRVIVCYKDASLDPMSRQDPSQATVRFRDPPVNDPEQSLLGGMYRGDFGWGISYNWVVADASNWVFANTGLKDGDVLPGLVGYEYDGVYPSYPLPVGDTVLASSMVRNQEQNNKVDTSTATLYTAQSGARVFNVATNRWSWGLDNYGNHNMVNAAAQRITENVLVNFITVPSVSHSS